jgi:hypothetical protein
LYRNRNRFIDLFSRWVDFTDRQNSMPAESISPVGLIVPRCPNTEVNLKLRPGVLPLSGTFPKTDTLVLIVSDLVMTQN